MNRTYDTNEWFDAVEWGIEAPTTLSEEEMMGRPMPDPTWEEDEMIIDEELTWQEVNMRHEQEYREWIENAQQNT